MIEIDMQKIKEIRNRFNRLEDRNEENIKIKIVVEILKVVGYTLEDMNFEHKVYNRKKIADIAIKINESEYFYIESKNGDNNLAEYDIIQLSNYMNIKNIVWGLLSNGKELVLINSRIKTHSTEQYSLKDKVVFRLNIMKDKDMTYLKFLSKEAMFEQRVTNYFKDIAQFKAYKYPLESDFHIFRNYKSTLNDFFIYYSDIQQRYLEVKDIRKYEFQNFLEHNQQVKRDTKRSITSQNTFKNKYSHLRSMLNEFKKQGDIHYHNFEEERRSLISKLEYRESNKDKSLLNYENISKILKFMEETKSSIRNKTIFLLSIYMGLERSILKNIEKKMFDLEKSVIRINGRILPLPSKLELLIRELIKENKSRGINDKYLFYTYYSKKYNAITESSINDLFIRFRNIDSDYEKWAVFSPQYIRECLIEKLFENNYSIEEISYLTGMNLKNISKYISSDKINNKVDLFKNKRLQRKHPFSKFLEI